MSDVTQQLNEYSRTYGGSDNTNPAYQGVTRSLDLSSSSNSLVNATGPLISTIPTTLTFESNLGLFGPENYFVKINLNVIDTGNDNTIINDYTGVSQATDDALVNTYSEAVVDDNRDLGVVNTFSPSVFELGFAGFAEAVCSLSLDNVGTGNIYQDRNIDATLYDSEGRMVITEDAEILINTNSYFYVGIHSRDSRRTPYKVEVTIGATAADMVDLTVEQQNAVLA